MRRSLLLAVCLLGVTDRPRAQERPAVALSGESRTAAGRIDMVRGQFEAKQWEAGLAALQNILETAGDELAPLGPDRAVQVRILCHRMLAALPPDALRLYRNRAEGQARKWLEQGLAARDERLLRRIVDEAFCTRSAEKALDALGDMAFERGRFDEAAHWWRMLTPPANHGDLSYPDPVVDAARTRAKLLLARLFHDDPQFADDLAEYRKLYTDAAGKLAGREGRYADILRSAEVAFRSAMQAPADWPTFGGDPARGRIVAATERETDRLGGLCRKLTWRFDLESRARIDTPLLPPQWDGGDRTSARSLAFHPVIVGDKVLVADARRVTAYDLRTGRSEEWYDAAALRPNLNPNLSLPAAPDLRYTLTVADGCVLARLGIQEVHDTRDARRDADSESLLACLDVEEGRDGRRLRWVARAAPRGGSVFEGSPVVRDGQVFIAATRCTADLTITAIHCYALESRGTPPLRWSRDVCATRELQGGVRRRRHHLLTLAGPNVVYCSHSGAIVALDALTGRHAWALRYPVVADVGPEIPGIDRPPQRDLTPCLYADGRLFAAPADSDRLFCLDPTTGRTRWDRKVPEIAHLLGVSRGRLFFTTGTALRAVTAATGADVWTAPDAGELPPMGRGLLLGDLVLWPTTRGVLMVRQTDGRLAEDLDFLHSVPKGNLAFGRGCLVVADRMTLTVFAPPALHLEERRREAEDKPDSPASALELGLALADVGKFDEALKTLETAEKLAKGQARREEARTARHAVLIAAKRYVEAADKGFLPAERVRALRLLAEHKEEEDAAAAIAVWQSLIEDLDLKYVRVENGDALPRTAEQDSTERIDALLKRHGRGVYQATEKRARARYEGIPRGGERIAELEHLTEDFPHAAVCRVALRELLDLYKKLGFRPSGRIHACQRLRANPGPEDNKDTLVQELTAALDLLMLPPSLPARLPLMRTGSVALEPDEVVAGGDLMSLITAEPHCGGRLRRRSLRTGKVEWEILPPCAPEWVSNHLDVLLIGGRDGLAAIRLDDGYLVWFFPARAAGFQMASDRVVFLEDGRLLAVWVRTGKVVWQHVAPGAGFLPTLGQFRPMVYTELERVLVQTMSGRRWLIDGETGRILDDGPSPVAWPKAPQRLSDERVLIVEGRRIVVLNMKTGREVWSTTVHAPSAISGEPPRVLGESKGVVVLIPTNLGPRLQRLDAATGKPVWPTMPLLDDDAADPADWGMDEKVVYVPHGRKVTAFALADGKPCWETEHAGPGESWRVSVEGDFVLAWPTRLPEWRFQFRSPLGALQWGLSLPPERRPGLDCPVLALDPETGKVVQRWNLPAGAARVRRLPGERSSWPVFCGGRATRDAGLTVDHLQQGFDRALVLALGGRIWTLRPQQ